MNSQEWWQLTEFTSLGPDDIFVYCPDTDDEPSSSRQLSEISNKPKRKEHDWILYVILTVAFIGGILIRELLY